MNVNVSEQMVYLALHRHALVGWVRSTFAFLVDWKNRDLIFKGGKKNNTVAKFEETI